jgi:hypothetical protein
MTSYTPSNDDIISPEPPKKNNSPLWTVILVVVVLLCCFCLCFGVLATWFFRFGVSILSSLFGG